MGQTLNQTQHIRKEFEEILKKEYPNNIVFKELGERIDANCRSIGKKYDMNSITAQFAFVVRNKPNEFGKHREKGIGVVYYYRGAEQSPVSSDSSGAKERASPKHEENFYESFAEFLQAPKKEEDVRLDECTKAVDWGGNKSGGKWGTPDVVGVFSPKFGDRIKFTDEIVSAEIKTDGSSQALITAFGQACAYRLFSHKVYLVVPRPAQSGQESRLKSLCHLFGLGLVYFNPATTDINSSIYKVQLLAQRHSPDTSYVNNFIRDELANRLYGKH